MEQFMWIIWLAIFIIALVVEITTSELVSLWFSLGGFTAMVLSFIPGISWWVELLIFAVVSFISFLFIRPYLKRKMKNERVPSNVDELIGKTSTILTVNEEENRAEAKFGGLIWTIVNSNEKEILSKGDHVTVLSIEGNKLIVRKEKEN